MLKERFKGKIITLAGCPAAGKTYLADIIAKELNAEIIYEHPSEGFPEEIKVNLKKQQNLFETIVFFRNLQIDNHLMAIELASDNKAVILDTPLYHNQFFVDLYIKDNFSRDILYKLGADDLKLYPPHDVTIYISTSKELVKEFLTKRYGARDWEEESWCNFISNLPPIVEKHMAEIKSSLKNLIILERENYDFSQDSDKKKVFNMLAKLKLD